MKKLSPLFIIFAVVCGSCSKNGNSPGDTSHEKVKYIILSTRDSTGDGLMCVNPDKTMRWVRTGLAEPATTYAYYNDGVLYATYLNYNSTTGIADGSVYVIDANTGNDIWVKKHTPEMYENVYVQNDTLYAFMSTQAEHFLVALNAKTGQELWRQPMETSWIINIRKEGNTLYFIKSGPLTYFSLNAFDITTRKIKWEAETNTFVNTYSGLLVKDNFIYMTSKKGTVTAFNKNTGEIAWVTGNTFATTMTIFGNNLYYHGYDDGKMNAVSTSDGSTLWKSVSINLYYSTPSVFDNGASMFADGKYIYLAGNNVLGHYVLYAINMQDGSVQWQKQFDEPYVWPLALGNTLYVFKEYSNTIVMYDTVTGNEKDSIPLNRYSPGFCEIVTESGRLITPN